MTTAELFSPAESDYLSQLTTAAERYAHRTGQRDRNREVLRTRGVLYADEPERVEKRLARLGADWALARAIEREPSEPVTAAGSTLRLPPESFGSDVLGLERLIGRNNLTPVAFLEEGALVSRSVGRITISGPDGGHGTGFLVSPSLLLTNNHVLRGRETAHRSTVAFSFQAGIDGRPLEPAVFQLEPHRFFVTDRGLDFSLVAVAERGARGEALSSFGRLTLSEVQGTVVVGEFVNIIQHPRGEPKQLALRENQVVDILDRFLHYESDTREGSSGSPVFNDQWEVVALHHSAVPKTDADGRPLSVDGTVWTPEMGDDRLAWQANEGVRISRVLRALNEITLTGAAARLRDEVFTPGTSSAPTAGAPAGTAPAPVENLPPTPAPSTDGATTLPGPDGAQAYVADGTAHLTVPLRISVGFDTSARPVATVATPPPGRMPAPSLPAPASAVEKDVDAALLNHRLARERPYYDRSADAAARDAYYADIGTDNGEALRRALTELLEETHSPRPKYKPIRLVYPWVDLHKDGRLRSIYSGRDFSAEEFIRADAAVEQARLARIQELFRHEGTAGPAEFEAEFDALEASMPFNCEHVVPQSWFTKREPMRGDLHHLFACEVGCNSFRGNFPYFDFPGFEEAVRDACGMREDIGFEPEEGKGAVARATLYFLLRYPGMVGDAPREFPENRLPTLLAWHENEQVSEYELHRNAAIAEVQGNRNPLIDHPEWAEKIDFSGVWP
ncbi:endonuclease I [Streptomyces ipomoeae]|jgi:endonuclease I/V8-like Glu-specific endopeptidase|uniref:Nuclease, EndA/NucM family n=2 Tax=Streptomyces ipomoeae TaxID=103232 RepID=L1KMG2_9ACTN|nr:endonuclease [Streptomyces ipomoeae]EKX61675.1 nuclease, EndA/NucM family [Streptomyces ipomoeae 91-03]MDX2692886.1 endonuclease [Streptomyces ipomoeae]MDX2820193.1 endonuclease [Streptomyces ipomoeae]MDX2840006.1 endonuclease [Streptomyces ipomoeae]MDX2875375.1 endonuclease [Streptomyces ipomoeae]